MEVNVELESYLITKVSWRGRYKRVFSIGNKAITTYNPTSFEQTNQWTYNEFLGIAPNPKSADEFIIKLVKGKKTDTMKFCTEHRHDLISSVLVHMPPPPSVNRLKFACFKFDWGHKQMPAILEVSPASVDQIVNGRVVSRYFFKDLEKIIPLEDLLNGVAIVHAGHGRMHIFSLDQRQLFLETLDKVALERVGIKVKVVEEAIRLETAILKRLGEFSSDVALTSYVEFPVYKMSHHKDTLVKRTLCITDVCLVDRDPATYSVVSIQPLNEIFSLVRDTTDPQRLFIEYVTGAVRWYQSTDRDSLLTTLLDAVRASGNRDIMVKMKKTNRSYRMGPYSASVDEEVESQMMKFIQQPPNYIVGGLEECIERFNTNINHSGLLHAVTADGIFSENKEKLIATTINSLLDLDDSGSNQALIHQFNALRRLTSSKAGFGSFTTLTRMRERLGLKVVKSLKRNDDIVTAAAVDVMCVLIQTGHNDLRQEQLNKASILSSRTFLETLLSRFIEHVKTSTGALVIAAMLDLLTYSICPPFSETTDGGHFDTVLELVALHGDVIYRLFNHPSQAIVKGTGAIVRAVIEEGSQEQAAMMQELSLSRGALLRHLLAAIFTAAADTRLLATRQLSRQLVALWVTANPTAWSLLKRILPAGLLLYLESKENPPENEDDDRLRDNLKLAQDAERRRGAFNWREVEQAVDRFLMHWKSRLDDRLGRPPQQPQPQQQHVVLRKCRHRVVIEHNWKMFYYCTQKNQSKPDLIWNQRTRDELKSAMEQELRLLEQELSNDNVVWNHQEFTVLYPSLDEEIKIGDYYLRLLLEEDQINKEIAIRNSSEFFTDLYHRFLLTTKVPMKCLCLQALSVVYGRCYEVIGPFNDSKYIVAMLDRTNDRLERDRLLVFISKLCLHKRNVSSLLDSDAVRILADLITLCHLHSSRATVPLQSKMVEGPKGEAHESSKEWYYGNSPSERYGPCSTQEITQMFEKGDVTVRTRLWAQGMDSWKPLGSISQWKWSLCAAGQNVLNLSSLTHVILDVLIAMARFYPTRSTEGHLVRPVPRVHRQLTGPQVLPHLVQLLLTFDPVIVEKVATLLALCLDDNPLMSRLYLTGCFYFILMYTGSNVLPIARLLQCTHTLQATGLAAGSHNSVLRPLLPEAMIEYLMQYSPEKFAEAFLSNVENPEVIWSNEMRILMINRIAVHIADFTPRLLANSRALYQYCPLPTIMYPQLQNELYCHRYYLRHLVNVSDYPISDPVTLLKHVLEAWKVEVAAKVNTMSVQEALTLLELPPEGATSENVIRKNYYKLAQKYHPDKNPTGRAQFEAINSAYEFLCTEQKSTSDTNNVLLILKTQTLLFSRYSETLAPYKYAGYDALLQTVRNEIGLDGLFTATQPLLGVATELCYLTVDCCALNAAQLNREDGLKLLYTALVRCTDILSHSARPGDLAPTVVDNVIKCVAVAAKFKECRESIRGIPQYVRDMSRVFYFKNMPSVACSMARCVTSLCADPDLQLTLHQCGVVYHLLINLFLYDYTLSEGGVERSDKSNVQELLNTLCVESVGALAALSALPQANALLSHLITPYLTGKLSKWPAHDVLKTMNSNVENPYLIWDNETRTELNEYLMENQRKVIKTGNCDLVSTFQFSSHSKELVVGEIFIRIFNQQTDFVLENPKSVILDLLDYLGSQAQYLESSKSFQGSRTPQSRAQDISATLIAVSHVLRQQAALSLQCVGHFRLLFSLLLYEDNVRASALRVLQYACTCPECILDIASCKVAHCLLMTLIRDDPALALDVLTSLTSNTDFLRECVSKGALIYVLEVFVNHTDGDTRMAAARLLTAMISDKLVGPVVKIKVNKFLPSIFTDVMRDAPTNSVPMFESNQENPELIWNNNTRKQVKTSVKKMMTEFYERQRVNPDIRWEDSSSVLYDDAGGELVVGGVYLRLFVNHSAWRVRNPKEFVIELMNEWMKFTTSTPQELNESKQAERLDLITRSIVGLLSSQPTLLDLFPSFGFVPRVVDSLALSAPVSTSGVCVMHCLSFSRACVQSIAHTPNAIQCLKRLLPTSTEAVTETLYNLYEGALDELLVQALEARLIEDLLRFLEGPGSNQTKAKVVKTLKAMKENEKYGDKVADILENSTIWTQFKDQLHDLFIADRPALAALTGSTGVAGYLTMGQSNSHMEQKPPE